MSSIIETIEVDVPVRTAYDQWTQFESFPKFMENIESITQLDDKRLHWVANIAGQKEEWDAEITQQEPDMRIAWKSTSGAENAGVVTFHPLSDTTTRVTLQMDWEPEGLVQKVGEKLGFDNRNVKGDLGRFKEFIEERGTAEGGWRGTVENKTGTGPQTGSSAGTSGAVGSSGSSITDELKTKEGTSV